FEAEDDVFDDHFDFAHIDIPSPEPRTPYDPDNPPDPPALPLNRLANQDRLESPPPPASPPLELDYDSDDSESNYEFSYAYNDPPGLRYTYLPSYPVIESIYPIQELKRQRLT
ncbi:hypothetical protein FRC11_001187, partial [Ceratobasidium sp. 423]